MTPAQSAGLEQRARELWAIVSSALFSSMPSAKQAAIDAIEAALAAPAADGVKLGCAGLIPFAVLPPPDGFVLVPVEPTPEMLAAAHAGEVHTADIESAVRRDKIMRRRYAAMLAAAPQAQGEGDGDV